MIDNKHIISDTSSALEALERLDALPSLDARTLFVLDSDGRVIGSITDGDIRRGLLKGKNLHDRCSAFMNRNFKFLHKESFNVGDIVCLREKDILLVPLLDNENRFVKLLDLKHQRSLLPISVLIMAGGRGERLRPLTDTEPKSMLKVGSKPIIEHNIDRLIQFGIDNFFISVNYLKENIISYLGNGSSKQVFIQYLTEDAPLGTIGALALVKSFKYEHLLIMNADILTNIDYEDFFKFYIEINADFCVASIPYRVQIPYAVLQTENTEVRSFVEKPTYTHYSSAGIYLMRSELKDLIPMDTFYNATDLMEILIKMGKKVVHYPLLGYWLDIGRDEDFKKAQEDIKHLSWQ